LSHPGWRSSTGCRNNTRSTLLSSSISSRHRRIACAASPFTIWGVRRQLSGLRGGRKNAR
jgi:hypothetical protein